MLSYNSVFRGGGFQEPGTETDTNEAVIGRTDRWLQSVRQHWQEGEGRYFFVRPQYTLKDCLAHWPWRGSLPWLLPIKSRLADSSDHGSCVNIFPTLPCFFPWDGCCLGSTFDFCDLCVQHLTLLICFTCAHSRAYTWEPEPLLWPASGMSLPH